VKSFFSFFVLGLLLFDVSMARADVVTGQAVVVNTSVVTLGEINSALAQGYPTLAKMYAENPMRMQQEAKKLEDQVIEKMVEDKLILHDFSSAGYNTNALEDFINDRIEDDIRQHYYGDRARLIRSLHEEGMTYDAWRRAQRENWIVKIMEDQNASHPRKILISPLKIKEYYDAHQDEFKQEDEIKLRMIALTNGTDPAAVERLGEEILHKLDDGVPFAELASVYSASAQRSGGGDYGWVNRTYFKESISKVAFSLKPGQHSGLLVEPNGCYLLAVDDVRPAHVKTLMEVRDQINNTLRSKENLRLRELWIERLKRKTFVNYY
jgi:peptidyl-prolyl cis-trans isomerase SurA